MNTYWASRKVKVGFKKKLQNTVSNNKFLFSILTFFTSVRTQDEYYLYNQMKRIKSNVTLDIACGWGKLMIPKHSKYVIGVDLKGYPIQEAKNKGYKELHEYTIEDYSFSPSRRDIDLITCNFLNAHLPNEALFEIIKESLKYTSKEVRILFLNEYDNNVLSYKTFAKNVESKNNLVTGMTHYYFSTELDFKERFVKAFPQAIEENREVLISLVPASQYFAYYFNRNPTKIENFLLAIIDVAFSIFNSIYVKLNKKSQGFLVGHIYLIKNN
jgi:2-polyprenyl-3-methyl-5-hydroxy-6-metoxy-1,4-benzoquinol methylase